MTNSKKTIGASIPMGSYPENLLNNQNNNLRQIIKDINNAVYYYQHAIKTFENLDDNNNNLMF